MRRASSEQLDLFDGEAGHAARGRSAVVSALGQHQAPTGMWAADGRTRRRRGRRAARAVPFKYSVGVGAFGWLRGPNGARLCETRLFEGRAGAERAILIALADGSTVLAPADGLLTWEGRDPEEASAFVGMPAPEMKRFKAFARRLDLHHVERHRSAMWKLLVSTVTAHALPCGYGLTAAAEERSAPPGVGLVDEDAEVFASAIGVRVAEGAEPFAAVLAELSADAQLGERPAKFAELLETTGWSVVLPALEHRIADVCRYAGGHAGVRA